MSKRSIAFSPTVKSRDKVCQECGSDVDLHAHHKVDFAKDGDDIPENGITLCKHCHADAHPDVPRDFILKSGSENAGRPPLSDEEPTVRVNAKVSRSVRDIIKALGDGNISLGIRRAVAGKELPVCPECNGSGKHVVLCDTCDGIGRITEMAQQPHCPNPNCNATGDDLTEHEFTAQRTLHCLKCGEEWEIVAR